MNMNALIDGAQCSIYALVIVYMYENILKINASRDILVLLSHICARLEWLKIY